MGFLSQIANIFTGSEDAKARSRAGELQQETAQRAIDEFILPSAETATARFDPLAQIGQRGIDLAGFLADPQAQAQLAFNNPLFQLSREALTEDINQSAASRGRLTAGDTLTQLQNAGAVAAQPFIDKQTQDILNLLSIAGNVAGNQADIDINTGALASDYLTGGAAARAAGIVGAQDARTAAGGNIFDVASTYATGGFGGGKLFGP